MQKDLDQLDKHCADNSVDLSCDITGTHALNNGMKPGNYFFILTLNE
jgi:hypothetical protein